MSREYTFTAKHEIGNREIELEVAYTCTPVVGATYWQPAEGGECEIERITHDGKPFEVEDDFADALLEMAIARSQEDMAEDAADEADYRYEEWRCRHDDGSLGDG